MKYFIIIVALVFIIVGTYLLSIFLFRNYIKPDLEDFNRKMLREHPEYFIKHQKLNG